MDLDPQLLFKKINANKIFDVDMASLHTHTHTHTHTNMGEHYHHQKIIWRGGSLSFNQVPFPFYKRVPICVVVQKSEYFYIVLFVFI